MNSQARNPLISNCPFPSCVVTSVGGFGVGACPLMDVEAGISELLVLLSQRLQQRHPTSSRGESTVSAASHGAPVAIRLRRRPEVRVVLVHVHCKQLHFLRTFVASVVCSARKKARTTGASASVRKTLADGDVGDNRGAEGLCKQPRYSFEHPPCGVSKGVPLSGETRWEK